MEVAEIYSAVMFTAIGGMLGYVIGRDVTHRLYYKAYAEMASEADRLCEAFTSMSKDYERASDQPRELKKLGVRTDGIPKL